MGKMTIAEAAQHFNVSKEAIHNRVRRGSLDSVIENGVKYVILGEAKRAAQTPPSDTRYYEYIEKENVRLSEKVDKLERETSRLREQREQMLIDDREKIERIYKERDEQLKSILQVVTSRMIAQSGMDSVEEDAVTAEVVEEKSDPDIEKPVLLKVFMKLKGYGKKKRKKIKARFKKRVGRDERIILKNKKLFLKPRHFDYSDLLK
ncbi:MAG: hypothetical protein B5M52_02330 [Helicobacteraceae bacterium 4484_230]|nr:MAG: hypothetical protein B5M52_02330 [Helicobacteraceae bacterium 4484_230]